LWITSVTAITSIALAKIRPRIPRYRGRRSTHSVPHRPNHLFVVLTELQGHSNCRDTICNWRLPPDRRAAPPFIPLAPSECSHRRREKRSRTLAPFSHV
jgi:hypothetical protein